MFVLKMRRFDSFKNFMRLDKKTPTATLLNIHIGFVNSLNGVLNMGTSG
jgi:hypothetical protein